MGGILGAIASLAIVPFAVLMDLEPTGVDLGGSGAIGLLGAPVGFVLGREAFPEAMSGGWRHALGIGLVIGSVAPPMGLLVIAWLGLVLPGGGLGPDPLSATGLLIVVLGIPYSFIALVVTLPVGLLWGVLVRLVPAGLPARLRAPRPLERFGFRHVAVGLTAIACLLVAQRLRGS